MFSILPQIVYPIMLPFQRQVRVKLLGLTQLMSFCVGADDSPPENILYKELKLPCGRLSSRPYIQLRNS